MSHPLKVADPAGWLQVATPPPINLEWLGDPHTRDMMLRGSLFIEGQLFSGLIKVAYHVHVSCCADWKHQTEREWVLRALREFALNRIQGSGLPPNREQWLAWEYARKHAASFVGGG